MLKASRYNIAVASGEDRLLFNTATTGLLRVDEETFGRIAPLFPAEVRGLPRDYCVPAPEGLDEETKGALEAGGFLVPSSMDELSLLRAAFEEARSTKDVSFTIGLTMACNFACPYCFEEHRPEHMSRETAEAVRTFIIERLATANAESVYVNWFGGEPLLNVDVLVTLATELRAWTTAKGIDFRSLVITNGALLTREVAVRLVAAGVTNVQVTIDGPKAVHDERRPFRGGQPTFDRIMANLRSTRGLLDVVIRVNVDTENRAHLPELVRVLAAEGFFEGEKPMKIYASKITVYTEQVQMAWQPLTQADLPSLNDPVLAELAAAGAPADEKRSVLEAALRPGSCIATTDNSFVIGPSGHLFKCELSIHDVREAVGTVRAMAPQTSDTRKRLPLLHAETGSRAHDWGAWNPFDSRECSSCRFVPVCKGGCPKRVLEKETAFTNESCIYWDTSITRLVQEFAG